MKNKKGDKPDKYAAYLATLKAEKEQAVADLIAAIAKIVTTVRPSVSPRDGEDYNVFLNQEGYGDEGIPVWVTSARVISSYRQFRFSLQQYGLRHGVMLVLPEVSPGVGNAAWEQLLPGWVNP